MIEKRSTPELLAPAGSMDSLKAGVNAGADAVYLSGKSFGARYYADNFNKVQMVEALHYAHLRKVKVYVTVNTLINDFELRRVAEYLLWLYKAGADAVILQDVGVASLCQELVPDLDMHASTQMTITSAEGVKWAYESGFKRVVLARELKLPEIEKIAQLMDKKIELEIFAHGALCYCYSGQCLLSSVIGGRSGNQGQCAQPCRKPYQLLHEKRDKYGKLTNIIPLSTIENYILSTRDLALYPQLKKIFNIPLDSLKIEGRMRSAEYVATVVSIYRKALDNLENDKWTPNKEDLLKLKLVFNRGFTQGYLLETSKESVMGRGSPGNRGLYLGEVVPGNKKDRINNKTSIKIKTDLTDFILDKGDGIVFLYPDTRHKYGMAIENTPQQINQDKILLKTKKQVPVGSKVHLTRDISLSNEAKKLLENKLGPKIPLNINMQWDKNHTPLIKAKFTGNNDIESHLKFKADFEWETAIKSPLSKKQIINQMKKTGGTPFIIKNIQINYPGNLFTPLSKLNRLRRQLLEKVEIKLLNSYKPPEKYVNSAEKRLTDIKEDLKLEPRSHIKDYTKPGSYKDQTKLSNDKKLTNSKNKSMDIAIYTSNLETLKGALEGSCKRIYFEPFLWEHFDRKQVCKVNDWETYSQNIQKLILDAQELCTTRKATLIWKWPSINHDDSLKYLSNMVKPLFEKGLTEIMISNMGAYKAINKLNIPLKISGSAALNIYNHYTVREFSKTLNKLTLSNELSKEELKSISNHVTDVALEFVVQGNLESMISEDCLLKLNKTDDNLKDQYGIKDNKNRIFPIIIDDESRTHIMNSVELCLINYIPDLYQIGFQNLVIDARNKTRGYAEAMVTYYRKGLNLIENGQDNKGKLDKLKLKVKKLSQGGITTGNFLNNPYKFRNNIN